MTLATLLEPEQQYGGLLDAGTIRVMLNLFETSSRDFVEEALEALMKGEQAQVMKCLHSLKGVAFAVGAQRLGAEARRIEQVTIPTQADCAALRAVYLETIEKVNEWGRSNPTD